MKWKCENSEALIEYNWEIYCEEHNPLNQEIASGKLEQAKYFLEQVKASEAMGSIHYKDFLEIIRFLLERSIEELGNKR